MLSACSISVSCFIFSNNFSKWRLIKFLTPWTPIGQWPDKTPITQKKRSLLITMGSPERFQHMYSIKYLLLIKECIRHYYYLSLFIFYVFQLFCVYYFFKYSSIYLFILRIATFTDFMHLMVIYNTYYKEICRKIWASYVFRHFKE